MSDNPQAKPGKRVALGQPIQWTDEELDMLAAVTPAEIELARQMFRANASPKFANLLDAKPAEDEQLAPKVETQEDGEG